jgi:hypothetical protein
MRIDEWWPRLDVAARQWLIENNGDVVPPTVLDQIIAVTGTSPDDTSWLGENDTEGLLLSDEAVDWIEQLANEEMPDAGNPGARDDFQ